MTDIKQFSAFTDAGKRPHNEDYAYPPMSFDSNTPNIKNLFIVCDGIGGQGKGDIAAKLAAASFATFIESQASVALNASSFDTCLKQVELSFDEYLKTHPECWGMGTTVVLLYLNHEGAHIAWAGNSRLYMMRGGGILFHTDDHTEVAQLLREGKITEKEAQSHSRRFTLLRAIQGSSYPSQLDYHFIPAANILPGDRFLLCSDGLMEAVKENEISSLFDNNDNTTKLANELRDLCIISASDNYAACLVEVGTADALSSHSTSLSGTPTVSVPEVSAVEVATPSVEAPVVETPSVEAPVVETPSVEAPVVETLSVEAPVVETPSVEAPVVATPSVEAPVVNVPVVETPSVKTPSVEPLLSKTPVVEKPKEISTPKPILIVDASANPPINKGDKPVAEDNSPAPKPTNYTSWVPYVLGGALLLLVFSLIGMWTSNRSKTKSYDEYVELASKSSKSNEQALAMSYLDSALMVKGITTPQISKVKTLQNQYLELKRNSDKQSLVAEGDKYAAYGKYPDLVRALGNYNDVIQNYGDNGGIVRRKADSIAYRLSKVAPDEAFGQLVSEIESLCGTGNQQEAAGFMETAGKLKVSAEKQKQLARLRANCANAENTAIAANDANNNRSVDSKDKKSSNPSVAHTPTAAPKTSSNARTSKTGANSSPEVVAAKSAEINNAPKLSGNALMDAKTLYQNKQYKKSESQLKIAQSSNKIDAEGLYLLSYIHYAGLAGTKNKEEAEVLAAKAAKGGWPAAKYLYGSLLLQKKTNKDSLNGIGFINQAAADGNKDAKALQPKLKVRAK